MLLERSGMSYCSGWAPTLVPNFWDLLHTPTWCDKQQTIFYVIGWLRLVFPLPLLLFCFLYDRLLPDSFWYPLSRLLKMAIMSVIADSQYYKFYNALYFVKSSMLLLHDNCIVIVCLMHTQMANVLSATVPATALAVVPRVSAPVLHHSLPQPSSLLLDSSPEDTDSSLRDYQQARNTDSWVEL